MPAIAGLPEMPGSGQARATASAKSFARRSQQADDASSRYGRSRSEAREEARAAKAATLKIVAGDPRVTDRASSTLDAPKAGAGFSLHDDDYIAGTPAQVAEQVIEQCRKCGAGHFLAMLGRSISARRRESLALFGEEVIPQMRRAQIG